MKIKYSPIFFLCILTTGNCNSQTFFDLPDPGNTPELFGPGIVSDEFANRDMAISPDGNELYYTLQYRGTVFSTILCSKKINGKWTQPEIAEFSGQYNDLEPAFSPDGKKLYFSSLRPVHADSIKMDYDLWYVEKQNGKWGKPHHIDEPVNTKKNEYYVSVAKNGNLYFTREIEGDDEDIMVCKWNIDHYEPAVSLPGTINSHGDEFNAFVDPSEEYLIFTAYKRKGNLGSGDLYISFKNKDGDWNAARNLGPKINGNGVTYCPHISPDKKFFFFTTNRGIFKTPFEKPVSFNQLKDKIHSPLNGLDNIYWMKAGEIIRN